MEPLKECTLLYVEDDPALLREMALFLAIHCRRVVTAADGSDALDKVAAEGADLVLTDIRMPKLDGLDLAAQLKERHPDLPVVLYTAFTDVQTLLRGIALGVAGFVQKPTDAGQLLATLEKAALPVLQRRQIADLNRDLQDVVSQLAAVGRNFSGPIGPTALRQSTEAVSSVTEQLPADLPITMAEVEKWALRRALAAAEGRRMVAARLLGMNYYTFRRHLERHGLDGDGAP